jgi:hypothetical protein
MTEVPHKRGFARQREARRETRPLQRRPGIRISFSALLIAGILSAAVWAVAVLVWFILQ